MLYRKLRRTCQIGSLMGENPWLWQPRVKFHIVKNVISQQLMRASEQLNMYQHVLSNGGMTLTLQGQGHSTRIREVEKNDISQ